MSSIQKAQTGKRVYNGAGTSPNKGQVSAKGAQGYIQRELRNKNDLNQKRQSGMAAANPKGSDGQSDSRSAVAAKSLARMSGKSGGGNLPDPVPGLSPVQAGRRYIPISERKL